MERIIKIVKNPYFIIFVIFILWIGFLARNNLVKTFRIKSKVNELEDKRDYYYNQIEETTRIKNELLNNDDNLEKFAREQYFMKRDNEEVIIIEEE